MATSSTSTSKFCDRMERIPQPLLPQHGGPASSSTSNTFTALLPAHPFLFRVYTPHARQNYRSPSPAHSRYGSRASSRTRTRPSSRAASPPPSRSMSIQHHPHSPPSRPLSRHSSYFSSSHSAAAEETDTDEPFFLSPRSKELRDAASDIVSSVDWRPRQRTLSTLSRFSGMSGMSGFSDVSTTAGALSDSWTSVGGETAVDEDMMIDVNNDDEEKEAENTVSELGLTRSLSSALIVPHSPTKIHRRAKSFESRNQPSSMSSSLVSSGRPEDSQILEEKPSLSTLLDHIDPGTRPNSTYVSASMSFFYALWEAVRRYRINVKHDVEIAIIDGKDFVDEDEEEGTTVQRVWTVDEMMHMPNPERPVSLDNPSIAKPLAHLVASQTTLIQGTIASSAVYSSLQLRDIIPSLPGYFFKHEEGRQTFDSKTFESLIWDAFAPASPEKKRQSQTSFRQFCATASKAFLADERSHGDRIRDSTTGAVNLAGVLVGRWAKARVKEVLRAPFGGEEDEDPFADPPDAEDLRRKQLDEARHEITLVVTHLTMLIAAWPSRAWFDTHLSEINGLIDDVVEIYVTGLIEAAQMDVSNGGDDERRGREEMREGHRVHSPIPTRRAFSITRGFQPAEVPVTPPRTPPHTPPSTISRAGSDRARLRSPLAGDSPSSVGKGVGRSLSFGGVLDSGRQDSTGGDSVSGPAPAAGALLPSAEIVAPRPHPPSRPLTPAHSSLHSRPSTPPIGSSVHFATPSPAPSPARHHSEIKRPKSPVPPVPPRRSSMRTNSAHSTPPSTSAGQSQNQGPTPFPTSAMNSPQPERSPSVSSRASLPHSKSQPEGILRKVAKEGSDDGSTKEKHSRLTWPRTLKRVSSVPGGWSKEENGSSESIVASSEKGASSSSVKNGEASLSKRNSLFGKPRQRTVTLTRATTGPKKDREIPKEMEDEHNKAHHGDSPEKRKRKMSLGHLDLGLHLGDLFKRGSKKAKGKEKGGTLMAGAIAAGALATQASGMISKSSSKATSLADAQTGASSTLAREDSAVSTSEVSTKTIGEAHDDEKVGNTSSASLSKSQKSQEESQEAAVPSIDSSPQVPVVTLLPDESTSATATPAPDRAEREARPSIDTLTAEGLEGEHDHRTILSPVHEAEREGESEDANHIMVPDLSQPTALPEVVEQENEIQPEEATSGEESTNDKEVEDLATSGSLIAEQGESKTLEDAKDVPVDGLAPSGADGFDQVEPNPSTQAALDGATSSEETGELAETVPVVEEPVPQSSDVSGRATEEFADNMLPAPVQEENTIEEVPRTPQLISAREVVAEDAEDVLEPSAIDPDIEWTDHEYGKSLESIDESLEDIGRQDIDVEDAPPTPIMIDVDDPNKTSERDILGAGILTAEDEKAIEEPASVVEGVSRELPGAFVLDEDPVPVDPIIEAATVPSFLAGSSNAFDVPSTSEAIVDALHKELVDISEVASKPSFSEEEREASFVPLGSAGTDSADPQPSDSAMPSTQFEDAPELELVELLRSSPQFKDSKANAMALERSVDGGASDDFDGMSETVFDAANSGHPSDDEDLSTSWKWMRDSTRSQDGEGEKSELRTRRRAHSLSSAERERVPSFLNPSEGSRGGRKDDDIPLVRSTSWAVSCFVCGVLVTLFVISTQRRDLLTGHRLT